MSFQEHPDKEVQQAIVRLNDTLCTWERATGQNTVLIIQDEGSFAHSSLSGKPYEVPDAQLVKKVLRKQYLIN